MGGRASLGGRELLPGSGEQAWVTTGALCWHGIVCPQEFLGSCHSRAWSSLRTVSQEGRAVLQMREARVSPRLT